MNTIYKDLYRFSSHVAPINLAFNQYLLLAEEPILVHTGSCDQARAFIPQLRDILGGKELAYVFVSHFESDECGGLTEILTAFPNAKVLCPEVTARQLGGFGLVTGGILPQKGGAKLRTGGCELEFIAYPSEIHLWEGLLLMEHTRKIFFSSDLVFRPGKGDGEPIAGDWNTEIEGIIHAQVPDPEKRAQLQQELRALSVNFIATGHGPCVKL